MTIILMDAGRPVELCLLVYLSIRKTNPLLHLTLQYYSRRFKSLGRLIFNFDNKKKVRTMETIVIVCKRFSLSLGFSCNHCTKREKTSFVSKYHIVLQCIDTSKSKRQLNYHTAITRLVADQ